MTRRILTAAGAALALAAVGALPPSGALAQEAQQPLRTVPTQSLASPSSISPADLDFVLKAALGGAEEVALGNLAQQKATSEEVERLADRIVQDHTEANQELRQIAESKGIAIPTSTSPASQTVAAAMSELSGAEFDRQYAMQQHGAHLAAVQMFRHASEHASDTDVKAFAEKYYPEIEAHTAEIEKVVTALQKSGSTSQ